MGKGEYRTTESKSLNQLQQKLVHNNNYSRRTKLYSKFIENPFTEGSTQMREIKV